MYESKHTVKTVLPPLHPPLPLPLHHGGSPPPKMGRHRYVRSALPPKNHHPPAKPNSHIDTKVRDIT